MVMQGEIDTSFTTNQRDLFTSGMAAQIGMNAFGVWLAIKAHADFNDGEAWPGIRKLAEMTGLGKSTVDRTIQTLIDAKLLRILETGKGHKTTRYIARERLDVRVGGRVLCTIVVDYVPAILREKLDRIKTALKDGKPDPQAFAEVDIIPGAGFTWNEQEGMLKASIPASEIPTKVIDAGEAKMLTDLQRKAQALRNKAKGKE
jgi:hypothetical protein